MYRRGIGLYPEVGCTISKPHIFHWSRRVFLTLFLMENLSSLFSQFCDYKLSLEGNTPRTIKWFHEVFTLFQKQTGIENPAELTSGSLECWILNGRKNGDWSNRTIRGRIQVFRLFLDWSVKRGYHSHNFARDMKLPRIQHRIRPRLDREQALSLLDWTNRIPFRRKFERHRAMAVIAIFLFSGIRRSELLKLEISDVRLSEGQLAIRSGKCDKDRLIPIHPRLHFVLSRYLEQRNELNYQCSSLIVSTISDKGLSLRALRRLLEKIRKFSGIPFSAHMLRHTFATLMIESGANIYSLQQMMGHSSIQTTTIYLSSTTKMLKNDMEKLHL